ncbi:MAG TPA: MmgE/PrpD family protein [Thermohalobaculum sp.]|nr:MmgE/PrpD family protein [Thermohalobaculum sp.]
MTTVALEFAEFAAGVSTGDLPDTVRHAAKRCLIDWWGGALAGSVEAPATVLAEALAPGGGRARLLPWGRGADPRTAALINGTAAHTVEVDDIYSPGLYHPGVAVIAGALAAADHEGVSGAELLAGIVAGYEVSNRIARTVNPAHYALWHTTATVGFFGAAAAAGRVLRLDAGRIAHALTTAATFAAGLRHAFSSDAMSKPLHAGRAAEGGVLAALGARAGLTGVPDMFEGVRGFGAAMSRDVDWGRAGDGLGTEWTITRMTCKPYPCCGHTFAAIDAARAVMDEGVEPGAIERVGVGTYRAGVEICENTDPKTPYEAKFSLPYTVALACLNRPVDLAAFAPGGLNDPELRAMMARVAVALDPEAEAAFPALRAAEVAITTRDGRTRRYRQPTRRGDPDFPVSDADLGAKFAMLAEPVIGAAAAAETAAALWRADGLERVGMIPAPERARRVE